MHDQADGQNDVSPPRTGLNFGLGLAGGVVASLVGWWLFVTFGRQVGLPGFAVILGGLFAIEMIAAIVFTNFPKWRGVAAGILVSICVAALVAGGLCFSALKNI